MKAHVKTQQEKLSLLETSEIIRINKVWMLALNQKFGFAAKRLVDAYIEVCKISGELYEDPEYWGVVDEVLIDKQELDFFPKEDLDEREKVISEIHKTSGKKWRQY